MGWLLWQSAATASAQRVGLVLSGGGAGGLAHVGVLKQLEANGIPIDYIVGNSMGGRGRGHVRGRLLAARH
ncbi:MAG: patatin-like phospholipase family protein [Hymenobacter sp.]